jgi:hypothetical protein
VSVTRQTTFEAISIGLPRRSFTFSRTDVTLWTRTEIFVRVSQGSLPAKAGIPVGAAILAEQQAWPPPWWADEVEPAATMPGDAKHAGTIGMIPISERVIGSEREPRSRSARRDQIEQHHIPILRRRGRSCDSRSAFRSPNDAPVKLPMKP